MTPLVATIGSRPSTVKRSVPDCTIHHSRVSPFIRRGVFLPGPIEIHCANRLSSSTTVSAQSAWPLWRASTSASFVCGRCTPVQPADFAFGDSTISRLLSGRGRAAAPVGACPAGCMPVVADERGQPVSDATTACTVAIDPCRAPR